MTRRAFLFLLRERRGGVPTSAEFNQKVIDADKLWFEFKAAVFGCSITGEGSLQYLEQCRVHLGEIPIPLYKECGKKMHNIFPCKECKCDGK